MERVLEPRMSGTEREQLHAELQEAETRYRHRA